MPIQRFGLNTDSTRQDRVVHVGCLIWGSKSLHTRLLYGETYALPGASSERWPHRWLVPSTSNLIEESPSTFPISCSASTGADDARAGPKAQAYSMGRVTNLSGSTQVCSRDQFTAQIFGLAGIPHEMLTTTRWRMYGSHRMVFQSLQIQLSLTLPRD